MLLSFIDIPEELQDRNGFTYQEITINDQTVTGTKVTGIGYIYSNTYTISYNSIYSYQCDASSTSLKNR